MKSDFKLARTNILWSSISILSKLFVGFAISVLIARSPSIAVYEVGQIMYAISLAVVASLFVDYGLDTYLIKGMASNKMGKGDLRYLSGFRLLLGCIVFSIFCIVVLSIDFSDQEKSLCILIGLAYKISVINRTYLAYFQSRHEFRVETFIVFTDSISLVVLVTVSLYVLDNVVYVGVSYLISRFLSLLVLVYFLSRAKLLFLPGYNFFRFKKYAKESFSFGLLALLSTTCIYLDTLLLRFLTLENPEAQVAYFQIAMQFVLAATLLPGIIGKGLLPILSSDNNQDSTYFGVNNILMTTGILVALFIIIYSEKLILFVYGEKYLLVADALEIVGVVIMMRFGMMYNLFLTIKGNNWFRVLGSSVMLIVGVVANLIFVPRYGFEGSAMSSIVSHVSVWLVYLYVIYKMGYPVLLGWNIVSAFVASIVFTLLLLSLKSSEFFYVLLIVVFVIVLNALFLMTSNERQYILTKLFKS